MSSREIVDAILSPVIATMERENARQPDHDVCCRGVDRKCIVHQLFVTSLLPSTLSFSPLHN